jgi:dolichyl-phosphate-mannose--protein O-mannosyl transferase
MVAIAAATALAFGLRVWNLGSPDRLVFDENYYAKVACIYTGASQKTCLIDSPAEKAFYVQQWDVGSFVHPPLGKWQIALGIKAFGMDAFGWRIGSVVAGTIAVAATALIAQLLLGSALWTFVAGLFMAVEDLNVVHSRLALLDIHLEMWIVVGFLLLLLDRRWIDGRTVIPETVGAAASTETLAPVAGGSGEVPLNAELPPVPSPVWRPWRFAAGAALGAATAVKWSGAFAVLTAIVIAYVWEVTRRRLGENLTTRSALARALTRESFGIVLALAIVPLVVYTLTWIPWLNHFGWSASNLAEHHLDMAEYHANLRAVEPDASGKLTPTHPAYSPAWSWPFIVKPVSYFVEEDGDHLRQILGLANPAIFWAAVWTLPYLAFMWRRRRDWRAGFVLLCVLGQWLPWFAIPRPQFLFYALAFAPFLVLAATYTARDLSDATIVLRGTETGERVESTKHPFRPFVWVFTALAVGVFIWQSPILYAVRIPDSWWWPELVWFRGWA